jgi:hypothetical protein
MPNAYKILVREPEWKRSLGKRKRKLEKILKWIIFTVVPCILILSKCSISFILFSKSYCYSLDIMFFIADLIIYAATPPN